MKHLNTVRRYGRNLGAAGAASLVSVPAFASDGGGGPDFTQLTSSVDFSSVATGVMTVGAAIVGALVAMRGAKLLLSFIRS